MASKIVLLLLPLYASSEFTYNTPQVYETDIITATSQFVPQDLQTEATTNIQNGPIYTSPPRFDFQEYQKRSQLDPQKYRYLQQQKSDQFHANEQYHANYRDTRKNNNDDQQFQASQESSVRVQSSVGQNWKVIHPKFVTENVKDYVTVTSLPTTMMEYQNTNPTRQQNLLEKEQDMKRTGGYDKITPTLVPTEDSNRKGRIYKKSLLPNSYQLEDKEPQPTQQMPVQARQDVGNLGPYVQYLNPHLNQEGKQFQNQDQLTALTSLLGKHPNIQLQGLNQLLKNAGPVYNKDHVPIHENNQESERQNNNQRHQNHQNYPTLNNNALENAIIAQSQTIQQSGAGPESLSNLQAQLDATAKIHADKIIAQAQQKALEHVQAQHQAIALAQAQAEKAAFAQVQAQNEALERAHAEAQAKAEQERNERERANVDDKKKKEAARLQRLTEERRRFQEQVRQQALQRKLREREERERQEALKKQNQPEHLPVASALQQDAASVAQKTRQKTQNKISPAESQNQFYHQVAETPYKLPSIHTYQPLPGVAYNAPKAPTRYTNTKLHATQTPSESFVNVHSAGYNQHTKSEEADVSKYFEPPQVTAEEYKNAKGEHDLLYAAKYAFGYRIRDYHNGNDFGHEEAKDGGQTKGHYHVLLPDGRVQNVHYIADEEGFHAKVSYGNGIASNTDEDVSK